MIPLTNFFLRGTLEDLPDPERGETLDTGVPYTTQVDGVGQKTLP